MISIIEESEEIEYFHDIESVYQRSTLPMKNSIFLRKNTNRQYKLLPGVYAEIFVTKY